ncbi:hypothetical protein NE237_021179 [Protea cynaroides]|uniref:Peptidase M10 metallopeptidase domain-containing protein n=1 Tax=Protea cynaroides TaxID=273540 RepID=A0A9Q0HCP7_9MAGN|nr:hypothetical protein NE237_021179 [Protea cynaroides]
MTMLTFTEIDADIKIGFYVQNHGDGESFNGVLVALAYAFSPTTRWLHIDGEEDWVVEGDVRVVEGDVTTSNSVIAVDLESVALHEIKHVLGMGHSSVEEPSCTLPYRQGRLRLNSPMVTFKEFRSSTAANTNYNAPAPAPSNWPKILVMVGSVSWIRIGD